MSRCRLGRRPADLLHEVADLHAYIERELHGVAVAVSDLDDFFFASTESSQPSNVNTRESGQAAAAARALAGRRLHAILSKGRKRILSALAQQRIILWEFSRAGDPTMDTQATTTAAPAAAEGEKQRDRKARTASTRQVEPHHQHLPNGAAAAGGDGDDWKRHTLVGMHRLLSRKASEQTATAAARATLARDMTKIAAALERLGIQTTAVAPLLVDDVTPPSSTPPATLSAPPSDELRCDDPATITSGVAATKEVSIDKAVVMTSSDVVVGVPATLLRREGEGQGCEGVTSSSSSSSSCRERGARQSGEGISSSDSKSQPLSTSSTSSSSNALLLQQLKLPDGIDSLLRRISEGVRPPSRNPVPAPQAASPAATAERLRPGSSSSSSSGLAARVATPPSVLSEKTRIEKRQGPTYGLYTAGCSNLPVGVGVVCDGSDATRETRCLGRERTRGVAGWDGGCNDGGGGIGGMEERRTILSPIGSSGACCLSEEGGVVTQRPGEVARVEGEEEAVGGGGGEGGSPNALDLLANRGSFEPGLSCSANCCGSSELGLSCSSVVAFASPTKGRPRSGGDPDGGDDKENRRV